MKDKICLIDRYKASPAFGSQTLPFVSLLDRPRRSYFAQHMTGACGHGAEVEILEKKQDNKEVWVKVRGSVMVEGKERIQEGWCKILFLEREGLSYFEAVNV